MGSAKRKNTKLRKALKDEPCLACGQIPGDSFNPIDPAHVRTFKVTQSDHPSNILSLCRRCHRFQSKGWKAFLNKYPKVRARLEEMGWCIDCHPFDQSKVILTHPEVK
jgi:hypothetical protein